MSWDDNWIITGQFYNADGTPDPKRRWSGKFSEMAFDDENFAKMVCFGAGVNMQQREIYYNWGQWRKDSEPVDRMRKDLFVYKKGSHRLDVSMNCYIIFTIEKE